MILSGEKKEEYRECTSYWDRRLLHVLYPAIKQYREYDAVEFSHGYSKNRRQMLVECKGVTSGIGRTEWGAPDHPTYIVKLGEILKTVNI